MKFAVASFVAFVLLFAGRAISAQESPQTLALGEINRDIWEPFVRGVNTFDHELYSRVRARDSVFVDGKRLFGYEEYVEDAFRVMTPLQAAGARLDMQVRFEERTTDGAHAFERGILRTVITDKGGAQRTGYARFQVISRRQSDGWRIVTDYRWRTGSDTDARAFDAARSSDSFE
ncbi:MAG: hypothetical protein ACREV5_07415 [Steroidobacter sp.]